MRSTASKKKKRPKGGGTFETKRSSLSYIKKRKIKEEKLEQCVRPKVTIIFDEIKQFHNKVCLNSILGPNIKF